MAICWRHGMELADGYAVHRIREPSVVVLNARDGCVDSALHTAVDFLEPVPCTEDGPAINVYRRGALVGNSPAVAPRPGARASVADLGKARAAEVLEHLRRERTRAGSPTLPVSTWIGNCPIVAGVGTI